MYVYILFNIQDTVSCPVTVVDTGSFLTTGVLLPVRGTSTKTVVCTLMTIRLPTTTTLSVASTIRRHSAEVDTGAEAEIRRSSWNPLKLRRQFRITRSGCRRLRRRSRTYTKGGPATILIISRATNDHLNRTRPRP